MNNLDYNKLQQGPITDKSTPLYTIGVAAKLTNTTVYALRMYENKGLILPYRTSTGRRLYSDTDITRLHCIRDHIDKQGLNIAGIRALMSLVPCWMIKPCSLEDRQNCGAYTTNIAPCWDVAEKGEICRDQECRLCAVYYLTNECRDIKLFYRDIIAIVDNEDGDRIITAPQEKEEQI